MKVQQAKTLLDRGELIGIPTETVYGLAGNAFNPKAVRMIFELKNRPTNNPLIAHVACFQGVLELVKSFPRELKALAENFWPGPLTMILPKKDSVPDELTGGQNTIAVRIPDHPITLELLKSLKYPLAAPSANTYEGISPTKKAHVQKYFGKNFPVLDGGPSKKGIESTIVGFENGQIVILRHGSIPIESLRKVSAVPIIDYKGKTLRAPGQAKKHYAPVTPLIYTSSPEKIVSKNRGKKIAFLSLTDNTWGFDSRVKTISLYEDPYKHSIAENLFDTLHQLDNGHFDLIVAEKVSDSWLGKAVDEKLSRASINN